MRSARIVARTGLCAAAAPLALAAAHAQEAPRYADLAQAAPQHAASDRAAAAEYRQNLALIEKLDRRIAEKNVAIDRLAGEVRALRAELARRGRPVPEEPPVTAAAPAEALSDPVAIQRQRIAMLRDMLAQRIAMERRLTARRDALRRLLRSSDPAAGAAR